MTRCENTLRPAPKPLGLAAPVTTERTGALLRQGGKPAAKMAGPVYALGPPTISGLRALIPVDPARRPRYARAKTLKSGALAWYWAVPTWAKRRGCPLPPLALGLDKLRAFSAAEIQNVLFDRWLRARRKVGKPVIPTSEKARHGAPAAPFDALRPAPTG
jgi:hypothetical protein